MGAGPAGLAAAMRLAQGGANVTVYEAASEVGGLARSIQLWDRRVDLGSHVIADDVPGVVEVFREMSGDRIHRVPLRRGIVLDGRCYAYPLRPLDIVRTGGPRVASRLLRGYVRRKSTRAPGAAKQSAAQWVVDRFGREFHESFFAPYAEKLWGVSSSTIDASFARNLVGAGTDATTRHRPWRRLWDRVHPAPSEHARSPDFLYPSDGLGAVSNAMAASARAAGAQLLTSTRVDHLELQDGRVTGLDADSGFRAFDAVVAALPLPVISRLVDAPPDVECLLTSLRTRSTVLVYLAVDGPPHFQELWRYLCDPDLRVGRVANLARWQPPDTPSTCFPRTLLCCELWCDPGDLTWRSSDATLTSLAVVDVSSAGLVDAETVAGSHVIRVPATHLVPELGVPSAVERVEQHLRAIAGLHPVGRGSGLQDVGTALQSGLVVARSVLASSAIPVLRREN